MHLTVLGCRAGMPADGQASSGYLVETDRTRLLLDCGPGVATALSAVAPLSGLDAIVISHFHSDHCYDLLPIGKSLLSGITAFPGGPDVPVGEFRPVRLLVPAGARERFQRWAGLFPVTSQPQLDRAFEVAFDVQEYEPGDQFTIGDCSLEMHEMLHAEPNCGTRIEDPGGTLAYTGDTGRCDAAVELAAGADVLLVEATLSCPDTTGHGHLSGAEAGRLAARAGVRELVLTHFASREDAWLDAIESAAAAEFDGPIRMAEPGLRCSTGRRGDPRRSSTTDVGLRETQHHERARRG